jgi:hypothetical protein
VGSYCGKPIEDDAISDLLDMLLSNKTGGRLCALPLVLGMPIVITENFDVAGGVVNGSTSILHKVHYHVDDDKRYLTYCIVEVSDVTADALPHLPPKHVAVLPGEVEMKAFRHPNSGCSVTLRCHQVPLDAAFAITAHKAQGWTMTQVVVDLNSCIGMEAAYVMISRCTSLEGLMILWPFPITKITVHWSQEAQNEFQRLDRLNTQTITECVGSLAGGSLGSSVHETTGTEGAWQVTTLFSGPNPPDVGSASELLTRIWDNQGGGLGKYILFPPRFDHVSV